MCFNLADKDSFLNLEKWEKEMYNNGINPKNVFLGLVGTKSDLKPRKVEKAMIEKYIKQKGFDFYMTSSVTGDGVNELFEKLFDKVFKICDEEARSLGLLV